MHNVPYGLAIWLGGLLLLIVVLVYVKPWWEARQKRDAPPPKPADDLGTAVTDVTDEPDRPGT